MHTQSHTYVLPMWCSFPHTEIFPHLQNYFFPHVFFFFLSFSLQPLGKSSWDMEHPNAASRSSTALSPAWAVGQTCWGHCWKLSLELRKLWGSFCPAATLPVQTMTRGWSNGQRCEGGESFCSQWTVASPWLLVQTHLRTAVPGRLCLQQFYLRGVCEVSITALSTCQRLGW